MGISTVSVRRPFFLDDIRQASLREESDRLRQEAQGSNDFAQLAESYDNSAKEALAANDQLREEMARLQTVLENERLMRSWDDSQEQELQPEKEIPPATIQEARHLAAQRFENQLIFGGDVDAGISGLAPDAGPEKVLDYLNTLAVAAEARKKGTLGTSMIQWLREKVGSQRASGEGETTKKCKAEMRKRTWDWGNGETFKFELHLKPSDGTSPDRCVRIYFDWCEKRKKIIIGWIGRHPV